MTVHNYRSRQVHETLNGVNPSSGFTDMRSAKSGPICGKFVKYLAHGQAHMGQMRKWPWQCTTSGLDNSTELQTFKQRKSVKRLQRYGFHKSGSRPPASDQTILLNDRSDRSKPLWLIIDRKVNLRLIICRFCVKWIGLLLRKQYIIITVRSGIWDNSH